jgi:hypothetical protein
MVAGIDWPELEGPTPDQIVAKAAELGTGVVVLASSAKVYADQGLAAARAAHQAGLHVCLAGRKTEIGDQAEAVIDAEIFDGMDIVAFLNQLLDRLGVAKGRRSRVSTPSTWGPRPPRRARRPRRWGSPGRPRSTSWCASSTPTPTWPGWTS